MLSSLLGMPETAEVKAVIEHTGKWQVMLLLLVGCNNVFVSINHTLPTFQGYTPSYFCQVDNVSATVEGCVKDLNSSVIQAEQSCPHGYQFQSDRDDWTVVTEWQLVCERRILRPLVATLYFCGVTLGAIMCGLLADRYGRRPVLFICLYGQGLLGVSLYFVQTLQAFMALRFIQGFFVQGLQGTTFTLLLELFPQRLRTAVSVVLELYWALGLVYLAGTSYYVPNWRSLELVLSAPTAATLFYVCLVPESARWLALHGRVEAQKAWKRILPYKQSDLLNDTDSAKKITYVLKHSGCDSSTFSQSKKANKQEVVNNGKQIKINSNPVDSVDFGYAETGIQLLIGHGEDCKGIRKQDMEGKLKVRSCNDSSVGIEHRRIMPEHIKNVENISSISLCKPDGCDSDRSQNSHYSKSSDISITEVNHLLSCEIMNNCRIKINETDRLNNRKNIMLVEDDEMANVTLLCTNGESSNMMKSDCDEELKIEKSVEGSKTLKACSLDIINSDYDVTMDTVSSPCHSVIVNEMNGIQKSNGLNAVEICRSSSKSDGLNFVWTETAQLLEDNEENSICLQSMSGRVDKTRIDYEGHEGEYTGKIFSVDDNKVNANPKRRTHTNIIVSGEEDSTSGTDVGFGNGMSCGNMVNKICKFAENKTVPYAPKKKETPTRCTGFFELFRNDVLRKYNVIMVFSWFSVSLSYYGIMFHLPDLSGERHLNFLLGAVLEAVSFVLAYIILSRYGRRLPLASFLLISGIICIVLGSLSVVPGKGAYWIGHTQTALALLGKGFVVCGFCALPLYASELFPTVLRAAAVGYCGFWGRVGSLIAPQLLFLGEYTLPAVPLVMMGLMGILSGWLVFALPETLKRQLPDTVEEVEMWVRNKRQM